MLILAGTARLAALQFHSALHSSFCLLSFAYNGIISEKKGV